MNNHSFQDKVALVTGGATGIGQAIAREFAERGGIPVIAGINETENHEACRAIEAAGGKAFPFTTDVRDEAQVLRLFSEIKNRYGRLDYAVNNAGIEGNANPIVKQTIDDYNSVIDVNLKGVWLCLREEIRMMLEAKLGRIVNVSSVFGLIAPPRRALYAASKHAVLGLTKALALEYARKNIRVNAICPGGVDTELLRRGAGDQLEMLTNFHPIGRLAQPVEMAKAVLWLWSDESSFVTGHGLVLDGGISIQ